MNPSPLPEHKLELESQFIMRLPEDRAETLREAIKSGEPLSEKLQIKFESDIRTASVRLDGHDMAARLYDLPTIIESYKTLDKKNFYKTADISQILICKEKENAANDDDNTQQSQTNDDNLFAAVGGAGKREFLFPHGITPPLKNVRKRRFRKTLKKKYVDYSEIEKEVKRLLKFDCEAIDSRFELVEENMINKNQENSQMGDEMNPQTPQPALMSAENSQQQISKLDLFGEECSSSDESDDDDDDDDKADDELEMDNDRDDDNDDQDQDEEMDEVEPHQQQQQQQEQATDIAAEIVAASDMICQKDDNEELRQDLIKQLSTIRERIQTQETEMDGLDNQALRQRLQLVLDNLHEQENEIKTKLDDLA